MTKTPKHEHQPVQADRLSQADRLERQIRQEFLPGMLTQYLGDLMDIEVNALWLKSEDGPTVQGYKPEDVKSILKKQAATAVNIKKKIAFIKKLIDSKKYN